MNLISTVIFCSIGLTLMASGEDTGVDSGFNPIASITRPVPSQGGKQTIGHAGASYYVPEETNQGYELAANLRADWAEPDLQLTQDGQLICMHDPTLDATTNVYDFPEYADRKTTLMVDGKAVTGVFAVNLTLHEISNLRVKQRQDGRSHMYDWKFELPTWQSVMDWQLTEFAQTQRLVGLMPELKKPSFYHDCGFDMEDIFLRSLAKNGYRWEKDDTETPANLAKGVVPIALQGFDMDSMKYVASKSSIPLIQLISKYKKTPRQAWNEKVLNEVATFAQAVAPSKDIFTEFPITDAEALKMASWAHDRALPIIPYTLKPEPSTINTRKFKDDPYKELAFYYDYLGSLAVFHEAPDMARQYLAQVNHSENPPSYP